METEARRSLELLWGIEPPPRRGPKPKVTVEQIVASAIAIADAEGIEAVSMRRVAEAVGLTAMSLYSYVPSKAELLDVMIDRVYGEQSYDLPENEHWRNQLYRLAHGAWTLYQRHPWILRVVSARPAPFGPNVLAAMEATLCSVSHLGLTSAEMLSIIDILDDYIQGAASSHLAEPRSELRTIPAGSEWFDRHGALLDQLVDFGAYPTLVEVRSSGALGARPLDFEFGLQRVLDGIESYIEDRRRVAD